MTLTWCSVHALKNKVLLKTSSVEIFISYIMASKVIIVGLIRFPLQSHNTVHSSASHCYYDCCHGSELLIHRAGGESLHALGPLHFPLREEASEATYASCPLSVHASEMNDESLT